MGVLDPESFLGELLSLFEATREKGSLYITVKRGKQQQSHHLRPHAYYRPRSGFEHKGLSGLLFHSHVLYETRVSSLMEEEAV